MGLTIVGDITVCAKHGKANIAVTIQIDDIVPISFTVSGRDLGIIELFGIGIYTQ